MPPPPVRAESRFLYGSISIPYCIDLGTGISWLCDTLIPYLSVSVCRPGSTTPYPGEERTDRATQSKQTPSAHTSISLRPLALLVTSIRCACGRALATVGPADGVGQQE